MATDPQTINGHSSRNSDDANAHLVELLVTKPKVDNPRIENFDEVLKGLEAGFASTVSTFASKIIELRISGFNEFNNCDQLEARSQDGQKTTVKNAAVRDENGDLFCVTSIENNEFNRFISSVLGRGEVAVSHTLSAAQLRLYLQFTHQYSIAISEELECEQNMTGPIILDDGQLETAVELQEMALLDIEQIMDEQKYCYKILLPLHFFQSAQYAGGNENGQLLQQSDKEIWQAKLRHQIARLQIPLRLNFWSSEMQLEDIEKLKAGCKLGGSLDLTNVKIFDADGVCDFSTVVEISQEQIQIRVVEGKS